MRRWEWVGVLALALGLACGGRPAEAQTVVNGNFESGNTGFTSDYTYTTASADPATYWITTNPSLWHGAFAGFGDHTTGSGLMMIVNGATTPQTIWRQTVTGLTPGTIYNFRSWGAVAHGGASTIDFYVNSVKIGDFTATNLGEWTSGQSQWNSGAATSAVLELRNSSLGFVGNDFALDDISFTADRAPSAVPEPSSALLFLPALAAIGILKRRRKTEQ